MSRESEVDRVEPIPGGWEVPTKTKTTSRTRRQSWGQVSAVIPASSFEICMSDLDCFQAGHPGPLAVTGRIRDWDISPTRCP